MNFAKPFGVFNRPGKGAASAIDFDDRALVANVSHYGTAFLPEIGTTFAVAFVA